MGENGEAALKRGRLLPTEPTRNALVIASTVERMEVVLKRIAVALVAAPLALGACQDSNITTGQAVGTAGGAAAGGLLGSQIGSGTGQMVATGAGVLLGALLGSEIGKRLDPADERRATGAFNQATAAPIGDTIEWSNPDSGNRGTVTPVREGRTDDGRLCREYRTTIYVEGKYEESRGTACRNSDGTWEMVT